MLKYVVIFGVVSRLSTIQKKLYQLIETDKDFKVFGSNEPWNGHHYILNPALSDEDLAGFEKYMNVTLPDEYRSFLNKIADGGAGPFYGLYSLNEGVEKLGIAEDAPRQDYVAHFVKFPITREESTRYVDKLLKSDKERKVYFDRDDYPEYTPALGSYTTNCIPGVIYLSEYGCGGYYVLVVEGDCYGEVWYTQEGHLAPLINSNGTIFSFFDWYEYWLDKSLQQVAPNTSIQ